jgi:hypothetical protein
MGRRWGKAAVCVLAAALALVGCGGPRVQTTRLTAVDLVAMTDKMAVSLMRERAVARRGADSTPWRIAADRVVNDTNDIIPEREKQLFLARLRALLNQSQALGRRNITFVREVELSGEGRARPTHALTAMFEAITHADRRRRSDFYLCTFQLIDLGDETVVWEDRYEVKRSVARSRFD